MKEQLIRTAIALHEINAITSEAKENAIKFARETLDTLRQDKKEEFMGNKDLINNLKEQIDVEVEEYSSVLKFDNGWNDSS